MMADVFGLHVKGPPTEVQIDAGAEALRERLQGKKITLRPWRQIPNSSKRKWRDYAAVVLRAAMSVS
jgi:hypothetical protein